MRRRIFFRLCAALLCWCAVSGAALAAAPSLPPSSLPTEGSTGNTAPDSVGDFFRALPGSGRRADKPAPAPRIPLGDPSGFPGTEVTPEDMKVFRQPLDRAAPGISLDGDATPSPVVPQPAAPERGTPRRPETPETRTFGKNTAPLPALEALAGQMLLVGFEGTDLPRNAPILESLRRGHAGGVLLRARNVVSPPQVRVLTAQLQRAALEGGQPPLFIAVPQEGGFVQVLHPKKGFEGGAAAAKLGMGTVDATHVAARRMGLEMAALGVNLDLAPAGDLNLNPLSPDVGRKFRSFGPGPERTAAHVLAFGQGLAQAGVIPCLTSFPGCGSVMDIMGGKPLGLRDIGGTWRNVELTPYRRAVENGWPGMIMPADVYHRGLDALYPVSLSPRALTDVLRGRLGFKGVILSGDLGAQGSQYTLEESLRLAVAAGADVLFLPEDRFGGVTVADTAHALLVRLVREGRVPEARLRLSWDRIMLLKERFLMPKPAVGNADNHIPPGGDSGRTDAPRPPETETAR